MLGEHRSSGANVVISTVARRSLRLPLEGALDLTYRCNNDCVHCWIRLPPDAPEREAELSFEEIQRIVREARRWGCQEWGLSGGEPMLRPDFPEIFDWLTRQCRHYILNTNGTLITPAIARLLTRPGSKLVALYGATAAGHDRVTRHPGSFEMTMRGIAYLREAGAAFTVQVIPMRANWEQYQDMLRLAEKLSPAVRMGAPWLYLSATRDAARNRCIAAQRLPPEELPRLDPPDMTAADLDAAAPPCGASPAGDDRLLAPCTVRGHRFYITPTGRMTFCCFAQDPELQYDLRGGSFAEAWERFLPALSERIRGGREYAEGCGACALRRYCRWCPLYGYLEHGRYAARVEYLCAAAQATRRRHEEWIRQHRRYYRAAGITFQVDSDLPFAEDTFAPKFAGFRVDGPGDDTVTLRHRFQLPPLRGRALGPVVYDRAPWRIHRLGRAWVFLCGMSSPEPDSAYQVAVFSGDFRRGRIYHRDAERFRRGGNHSLTLWATDQVLMGQLLAERQGGFVHASGVIRNGRGLLLAGHTGAEIGRASCRERV